MKLFRRHHPDLELSRYVDGELRPRQARAVREHLESCARCRRVVQEYRRIAEAARSFRPEPPDAGILEEVLERRAAGDRVILPVEMPALPEEPTGPPRWAAIAALLLLALAGIFALPPLASADRPVLSFTPEVPLPGRVVEVRYSGNERFAVAETLVLRARLVTATGRSRLAEVTTLTPVDGGFRGIFRLADSVVYGEFAVESLGGDVVDSNGRRYWQLLTGEPGAEGPSRAAMAARVETLHRRAPVLALEAAEQLTVAHPDRVESWYLRGLVELSVYGALSKPMAAMHEERLDAFADRFAAGELPSEELPWLAGYLRIFGRDAGEAMAAARRAQPHHPTTLQWHLADLYLAGASPEKILAEVESHWSDGIRNSILANRALDVAVQLDDSVAIEQWVGPTLSLAGAERTRELLLLVSSSPALAEALVDELYILADERRWSDASIRPLHATHAEQQRLVAPLVQRALTLTADQLLARNDTARALSLYRQASQAWWDVPTLRHIAGALDTIDDAGAGSLARSRARLVELVGNPVAPRPREGGDRPIDIAWTELRTDIMRSATSIYLDPSMRVRRGGTSIALDRLGAGEIRVLAVDDASFPRRADEDLSALAEELERAGIRLIHVLAGADPEACARGTDTVCDPERRTINELDVVLALDFFVLDRQGRVRFAHVPRDQVVLLPSVLRAALPQPPPTIVD